MPSVYRNLRRTVHGYAIMTDIPPFVSNVLNNLRKLKTIAPYDRTKYKKDEKRECVVGLSCSLSRT